MQKIITSQELIFNKIWKTSIWPILSSLWSKHLGKSFPKKSFVSILNLEESTEPSILVK